MLKTKDYIGFGLTAVNILVAGFLGFLGFRLSAATERIRSQVESFDKDNKQYAVVTDLLSKCTSDNPADRNFIFFLLRNNALQKGYDLATAHPALHTDSEFRQSFKQAMDACFVWVTASKSGQQTSTAATSAGATSGPATSSGAEQWVYLGTYSGGHWATQYLNFTSFDPTRYQKAAANGPEFGVNERTGDLYLRTGEFGVNGAFPPTTGTLKPGQKVQIIKTWPWYGSDNWWAVVKVTKQ